MCFQRIGLPMYFFSGDRPRVLVRIVPVWSPCVEHRQRLQGLSLVNPPSLSTLTHLNPSQPISTNFNPSQHSATHLNPSQPIKTNQTQKKSCKISLKFFFGEKLCNLFTKHISKQTKNNRKITPPLPTPKISQAISQKFYWSYFPHWSRDSLSRVCGIFL